MKWNKYVIIPVAVAAIALGYGLRKGYAVATEEVVQTYISKTDRECKSSNECRYVVYTPDEVFENVDSWLYFKFNSSDFQNKLVQGKEYRLTVYGFRVPFLSWYRNVVKYEPVNE